MHLKKALIATHMRDIILGSISLLAILCSCQKQPTEDNYTDIESKEISFVTTDSIKIYGDLYEIDKTGPVILLFHQGGSNARAEYGPIIPQLINEGFNILAIDQRMGGQFYGNFNRTLAEISDHSFENPYTYCDAYNNLEGALNYVIASNFIGNKIIWGSSYSASLAIKLANNKPDDVQGVLAFSPASGGSMKACLPDPYFETLRVPLLMLRPASEMENEKAKNQFELAKKYGHQTYTATNGVHGSSMLAKERVGFDVSETWHVVYSFLRKIK